MDDKVAQQLYDIVMKIRQLKHSNNNNNNNNKSYYQLLPKIHLIRVPKASSSSLSAITRRIVGCNPPGPCCRYPGDPIGSCPAPKTSPAQYLCPKVIGCTGHHPFINILKENSKNHSYEIHSISMMREPISRSLSAFSYHPPHTIVKKKYPECSKNPYSKECFKKYLLNRKFKNIVVKMLSGSFPYNIDQEVCQIKCQKVNFYDNKNVNSSTTITITTTKINNPNLNKFIPKSTKSIKSKSENVQSKPNICIKGCLNSYELALENLDKLTLMGISELWSLSILLLYIKIPQIEPKLSEIVLESTKSGKFSRMHDGDDYKNFKKIAKTDFTTELYNQNSFDIQLYKESLRKLCIDLHIEGIWKYEVVQQIWMEKIPSQYIDTVPKCNINPKKTNERNE